MSRRVPDLSSGSRLGHPRRYRAPGLRARRSPRSARSPVCPRPTAQPLRRFRWPWIRLADRPARVQVARQWRGDRRRFRVPAVRPSAGWRSSSLPRSGGAGTTGTGAVRGLTRRPTSPAAAGGRGQPDRGWGSPWLRYRVGAGGLGAADRVGEDSGAWWSPRSLRRAAWYPCADSTVGSGGGVHHAQRPTRSPIRSPARSRMPCVRAVRRRRGPCRGMAGVAGSA
jgi:hypothetical protein